MLADRRHINRERVRALLPPLQPVDRANLIRDYVDPSPLGYGPDKAVVREHNVSVWTIIADLVASDGNIELVREEFNLSVEAVYAAILYYLTIPELIEARIILSEAPFQA